jgi:hypothetical protein
LQSGDAGNYRSSYSSSAPKLQVSYHPQFELDGPSLTFNEHVNAFEIDDKVWMKDSNGFFTVLAWVVQKKYNEGRDGWDYWVVERDITQTYWLEGGYWRAETELRKA